MSTMTALGMALLVILAGVGPAVGADIRVLGLATNDLAYDPTARLIYASVPGRAPGGLGNSVVTIDPETGVIGPPVLVGSEPNRLVRSDDGQFLYVALDGIGAVRRFDITTHTPGLQFLVGSDPFSGTLFVEDMVVLQGAPRSVAISRRIATSSTHHMGVAIYDDGVQRPNTTGGGNVIEPGTSPTRLYGLINDLSTFAFSRLSIDSSGVSLVDEHRGFVSSFNEDMAFSGGLIYLTNGKVVDPEPGVVVGTFPGVFGGALVRPESAAGRVFFLTHTPTVNGWGIAIFDTATFSAVGSIDVPGVTGVPRRLIRWGADGLAFRTDTDQVFLIRGVPGLALAEFVRGFYSDVLGRGASDVEVAGWVSFLRANPTPAGVSSMAHAFLDGPEFLSRPTTQRSYVALLYGLFLGRAPDAPGLQGWVESLQRAFDTALPGFVNSAEFRALVPDTQNRPAVDAVVRRLYQQVLGRTPAASEVAAWTDYVAATGDLLGVATGFFDSAEYNATPRTLAQHVIILYRTFLGREPAPSEVAPWVSYLESFRTGTEDAFVGSPEFQARLVALGLATGSGTPPTISHLTFAPASVPRGSGDQLVSGTVDFVDPDGDIAILRIVIPASGQTIDTPIDTTLTSGRIGAVVRVGTAIPGNFTVNVQAFDRRGNASNILTGIFTITP